MHGSLYPALIAGWISIGMGLAVSFGGVLVAIRKRRADPATRSNAELALFVAAILLTLLLLASGLLVASRGLAFAGLVMLFVH